MSNYTDWGFCFSRSQSRYTVPPAARWATFLENNFPIFPIAYTWISVKVMLILFSQFRLSSVHQCQLKPPNFALVYLLIWPGLTFQSFFPSRFICALSIYYFLQLCSANKQLLIRTPALSHGEQLTYYLLFVVSLPVRENPCVASQ